MSTNRRRHWSALIAALALGVAVPASIPAANSAQPQPTAYANGAVAGARSGTFTPASYCGIVWGSLARHNAVSYTTGTVANVRSGRHACYDRLVVDVAHVPESLSYDVRYVDAVRRPGSGTKLSLNGGADLQIELRAPAYDGSGKATYQPADPMHLVAVGSYDTFRQVAMAGSFEGSTTFGLGVRARLPFRVLVLDGPGSGARLVIDVAHRW
ncbi:AMIN-like domain-containing (lipo)protein [Ornithinicoccus hortensis]|uniref:AMIN-like domain-containing protein n=1 Tax=Ornithinicoccus hortensis TaxID=82346 RepID=A0A542YWD0_9MICO|nr:hypothetical protein [Ornithinicoccus hortensis]TQL52284.1 hypothetical protein FB467_3464 [Ornithinicoccus hortensis]